MRSKQQALQAHWNRNSKGLSLGKGPNDCPSDVELEHVELVSVSVSVQHESVAVAVHIF